MPFSKTLFLAALLVLAHCSHGSELVAPADELSKFTDQSRPDEQPKFMDQSWLAYWGVGIAAVSYPDPLQKILDHGNRDMELGIDAYGFYWPMKDRKTAVGVVVNGVSDLWTIGSNKLNLYHFTYGASVMHSLKGELGDSLFLRADLGPANIDIEVEGMSGGSQIFRSPWGVGAAIGLGVMFGEGAEHRWVATALYSPRFIDGDLYPSASANLGFLW